MIVVILIIKRQESFEISCILHFIVYRVQGTQYLIYEIEVSRRCNNSVLVDRSIRYVEARSPRPLRGGVKILVIILGIDKFRLEHTIRKHREETLQMVNISFLTRRIVDDFQRQSVLTFCAELVIKSGVDHQLLIGSTVSFIGTEIDQLILIERIIHDVKSDKFFDFINAQFFDRIYSVFRLEV